MTQIHSTGGGQEQGRLEEGDFVQRRGGAGRVFWCRRGLGCGQVGTLGQRAGLVGRWPVEQQVCDGHSSEWHPQTARTGAFSETESGLPWRRQEGGR